jgi:hypothetical protein
MKKITLSVAALLIAGMSYGQSTQCESLTKDSVQCKNKTTQVLCYLHNPNYKSKSSVKASVCVGTTKKGNNCKNKTKNANQLCHLHTKKD